MEDSELQELRETRRPMLRLAVGPSLMSPWSAGPSLWRGLRLTLRVALGCAVLWSGTFASRAVAQTCTTQARMQPALRSALSEAALAIGSGIKAADVAAVRAASSTELVANFGGTEAIVRSTSPKLAGSTLRVSQMYELDASTRKPRETESADFSCPLMGVSSETDFSIAGLPQGDFGFVMVEASGGEHPWLLSMLLQREGSTWKMAGLYPHARTAAGHDGLWYWTNARAQAAEKHPLLAGLYYTQAEALLQPAPFVSSTNHDKLRSEMRASAPEFADGFSVGSPLVVKGSSGAEFRFTSVSSEAATDDKSLRLMLHTAASPGADAAATRATAEAAARAVVGAHPELRNAYSSVYVFAEVPGGNPVLVSVPMGQLQ